MYAPYFSPSVGGAERFGAVLAKGLAGLGVDVCLVTATPGPAGRDDGYQVVRRPDFRGQRRLAERADVVFLSGLSRTGALVALIAGKPAVVTHHGYQAVCATGLGDCRTVWIGGVPFCDHLIRPRLYKQLPRLWWNRGTFEAAKRVPTIHVTPSRFLADALHLEDAVVIPNPVDSLFHQEEVVASTRCVGFVGALSIEKGFDLFCSAVRLLASDSELSGIEYLVLGNGPLQAEVDRLRAGGIDVSWNRFRPEDVAAALRRVNVLATPSRVPETFCYSAAEALCSGVPVVASRAGALPEVLGDLGEYVNDLSSGDELSALLRTVLELPAGDRERWRQRAARASARFDERSVSLSYADLLRAVA
jgi:glycosyltransferase involved in cell wall biosynthesis